MRVLALVLILISLSVVEAFAQSAPAVPTVVVTPAAADLTTPRQVHISGLAPQESDVVVLFDPSGQQTATQSHADSSGAVDLSLQPPSGRWQVGMYRVAVGRLDDSSMSTTFVASDGKPHLFAEPNLPSPTSALNFVGTGLPPNQHVDLSLYLTGGQGGIESLPVTTDANGAFSTFVWPQQLGLPFFAAGDYLVTLPAASLSVPFTVREHPVSASPSISDPVLPGADFSVHLDNYPRNTYVWGLYADMQGHDVGEFLIGLIADSGQADARIPLPILAPGPYLLATPYDWGETAFTVLQPTPTPTAAALPTVAATATPKRVRPTATPTPKPLTAHQLQEARQRKARAAAAREAAFCRTHWWWHRCIRRHHKQKKHHR